MRALLGSSLLLLAACQEGGLLDSYEIPDLDLRLDEPTYGAFAGAGPARVAGTVQPPEAVVRVEGQVVEVQPDGRFEVLLPFERPYRIIEVSAEGYQGQRVDHRYPVFQGFDPLETWPGAVTLRLTPFGLDGLARTLESTLAELLGGLGTGALQPIEVGGFTIEITGVTLGDLEVELDTAATALELELLAEDVVLQTVTRGAAFGQPLEVPGSVTFPEVGFTSDVFVRVNDAGQLVAGIAEPKVDFEIPTITFGQADLGWLADLIAGQIDLEALLQEQLDGAMGDGEGIPLGDPIAFETDALGTTLSLALLDARTDLRGLGFGLGVGIGGPVPASAADVPLPPGDFLDPVDLSVAVHDGLLQVLLASDLLSMLEQDLELPGQLGMLLDPMVRGLPGGRDVPDHDGWCLRIDPGEAKVARFGVGDAPLAGIYLPDARVAFLYRDGSDCEPWLSTSLALEVLLDLDGTKMGFDLAVPEGIVLEYGAELDPGEEQELVAALGTTLERLLGLLGGSLGGIDLGDLLGGIGGGGGEIGGLPLDGLEIAVGGRRPMRDAEGAPIDGMVELGVQLFGPAR